MKRFEEADGRGYRFTFRSQRLTLQGEKAYTTKELAMLLEIGTSTLSKWCLSLEENGYPFARVEHNKRLFLEKDIVSLKNYTILIQEENFSLSNASKIVAAKYIEEETGIRTPSVPVRTDENQATPGILMQQLLEYIKEQDERTKQQDQFNQQLLKRIEKQDALLEERLKERDNKLMETLNTVRGTKEILQKKEIKIQVRGSSLNYLKSE